MQQKSIPYDPRLRILFDSYRHFIGEPLAIENNDLATALWLAPRVIVAHDTQADPIFFYGNQCALQTFEMDFAEFTQLPSRFSAEPGLREERERLLQRVSRDGFIDDYSGVRIAASGRRFRIERGIVWNLIDKNGIYCGQAATFVP